LEGREEALEAVALSESAVFFDMGSSLPAKSKL